MYERVRDYSEGSGVDSPGLGRIRQYPGVAPMLILPTWAAVGVGRLWGVIDRKADGEGEVYGYGPEDMGPVPLPLFPVS